MITSNKSDIYKSYLRIKLAYIKNRPRKFTKGRPLIVGFLSAPTGLGQGARLIYNTFKLLGYEPNAIDITQNLQPGLSLNSLHNKCSNDDFNGPIILHVNPPELLSTLQLLRSNNLNNRRLIGVWAWEQELLPKNWISSQAWLDEIWGISHFNVNTFKDSLKKPVVYVPYPASPYPITKKYYLNAHKENKFSLYTAFDPASDVDRKNPKGAVAAFQKAFPNEKNVRLNIKITKRSSHYEIPQEWKNDTRINIIQENISDEKLGEIIMNSDCILSLHRAEGYGLVMARALASGIPIIATNYSGNCDFMTCPHSYPVDFDKIEIKNSSQGYDDSFGNWANPNLEHAVTQINYLYKLPKLYKRKLSLDAIAWWQKKHSPSNYNNYFSKETLQSLE